ncbi:MAG: helix-turn-helix domain-containing protein [Promethearchaeia archaeon]
MKETRLSNAIINSNYNKFNQSILLIMNSQEKLGKDNTETNEDAVFKSLSHEIRRDIIRHIGNKKDSTFTDIKNNIITIDSPTLSYHLKSLNPLIIQKESKYYLSEIGKASFNLLEKIDQSERIQKGKKRFLYAYIASVLCWISASTIIPLVYLYGPLEFLIPIVQIVITIISSINYVIIWKLRKSF